MSLCTIHYSLLSIREKRGNMIKIFTDYFDLVKDEPLVRNLYLTIVKYAITGLFKSAKRAWRQ